MKRFLFIASVILSLIPASDLYAEKKVIPITTKEKIFWGKDKRSVTTNSPSIYHDENTLYIHSCLLMEETILTIKDEYNNIVCSIIGSILPDEENIFEMNIKNGTYTIELESKENIYYGYFEIIK